MKLSNSLRYTLPALVFTLAAAITLDSNLPSATLGQPYTATLNPTGGTSPYTHTLTGGSLPPGLSLSGATITGTPQSAGQYSFSVLTTDSLTATTLTNLNLRVANTNGIQITINALATGRINTPYDMTLTAQGGASPYSWDIVQGSGTLPPGITLSAQGRLQGTPSSGGIFPLTIRVTDASGNSYSASLPLRIEATSLAIATNSLAGASTNVPYSQGFASIGGTPPYTYSLTSGTLPPGLTLTPGGVLSGTPTTAATYNFTIRTTDATTATAQATFAIIVSGSGPRILISTLPTGILNQPYNASLSGQGGTPPYTFSLAAGTLPAGLLLNLNGTLTGAPNISGAYPITIRIGDANQQSSQADLLININSSTFSINSTTAPDGVVNTTYLFALTTSNGTAPNAFTLLSGTLPNGLILNSNGTITGTPTTAGNYQLTVRATDAAGATAQFPLTIRVLSTTLTLSQSSLANGQLNQPYTSTLSATGGSAPYNFNIVTGTLPPGLTLSSNGNISGTPTTAGIYQITYRVLDANQKSIEATLPLFITGGGISLTTLILPSGRPNQAYSTMIQATGGTAPYSVQLTNGSLPTGLTLSSAGLLSGTLTQPTNGAFTVRITDAAGASILASYLFNVNTSIILLTSTTPTTGSLGQLYTTTLTTSGGTGTNTYSLDTGTLPSGLTLSSSGTLSGTPTAPGTYIFNINATDAALASALFSQAITIGSGQLGFATSTLPSLTLDTQYFATFTGINGTAPYTFTLLSGTLPPGITLASNGNLTGSASSTGTYPVTLRITDATGATATLSTTLTVNSSSALTISTTALPSGRRTESYSVMLVATGGRAPYNFQLLSGSTLPAGLTLSTPGLISGMPTADGTTTFTIRVTDANGDNSQRTLTLNINSGSLNIASDQFSNGIVGSPYTSNLTATGGTPTYSFNLLSGTLPPGLSFSPTGILSGTPSLTGTFPIVIRLTDSAGATTQKSFNILIGSSALSFTNVVLPMAYLGQNYRANLQAAAGAQPYTFSIVSGNLPAGLTLDSNGTISGTPTVAGQSTVTFKVTDASGGTAVNTLTIGAMQSPISFGFTTLPNATVGQPYNFTTAGNGTGPFTFYILSGLPPGIFIDRFGNLVGVPTRAGTYNVTIQTQNLNGDRIISTFPLTVLGAGFRITSLTLPNAQTGQAYSQTLTASGGTGNTEYTIQSGTLPTGFTLTTNGLLSGTTTTAGTYPFTIRATDSSGTNTTAIFALTVTAPVVNFTTDTLPSGTINMPYSQTIAVTGGTAPYTFRIDSGSLPTGLTLSPAGVISGTPTAAGNFSFVVRATDTQGQTSTASYLIGLGTTGAPTITAVLSAANYIATGIAPGEIVVLYGTNIGPANLVTSATNTRVLFDGIPAPILYSSATQTSVVVPFSLVAKSTTSIVVEYLGASGAALQVPVRAAKPAIFTTNSSGTGPAAILNQDATVNTALNPAAKLSIVSIYATGLGQTNPASQDGVIVMTPSQFSTPVTVTINGQNAQVLYAGGAPGQIPGLAQINITLPAGTVSGPNSIQITSGSTTTSGTVTVFVN
jgi:uncharacterized protein (TIGR03437 family)